MEHSFSRSYSMKTQIFQFVSFGLGSTKELLDSWFCFVGADFIFEETPPAKSASVIARVIGKIAFSRGMLL